MLRLLVALSALLLGACAQFHRPLAPENRARIQEIDLRVVVAQESFMFSAQSPGVAAATGGGLVGALIDSSVQQSRQKAMSGEVQATVGPLLGYDFRVEAARAVADMETTGGVTFPFKVRSAQALAAMPTEAEQQARIAATRSGPAYMVLVLYYTLEPGLGAFTTRSSAFLWQAGQSEPSYRAGAIYQTPIGGNARATILRRLTADDGLALKSVMRESVTQTLQVVAIDVAAPVKPMVVAPTADIGGVANGRFNVSGVWLNLAGTTIDRQPGRVMLRGKDGILYSLRSAAP